MGAVVAGLLGRFGNQLFSYAYARAYAESVGADFFCEPWIGQQVFTLDDAPPPAITFTERCETNLQHGEHDICLRSYGQQQRCLLYTRDQIQRWFRFRPNLFDLLTSAIAPVKLAAHRRVGDYPGYGYPTVSELSYLQACADYGLAGDQIVWVTEEAPLQIPGLMPHMQFLPDFYRLMTARVLLRGNSSFSWWAAGVGTHDAVYSPCITGLIGGMEHDCRFVPGNHAKLCNLDFVTDLYLMETN